LMKISVGELTVPQKNPGRLHGSKRHYIVLVLRNKRQSKSNFCPTPGLQGGDGEKKKTKARSPSRNTTIWIEGNPAPSGKKLCVPKKDRKKNNPGGGGRPVLGGNEQSHLSKKHNPSNRVKGGSYSKTPATSHNTENDERAHSR